MILSGRMEVIIKKDKRIGILFARKYFLKSVGKRESKIFLAF